MRIFYAGGGPIPSRKASSLHVMKMCQAFARNGHDVTLITSDWPEEEEDVADPFAFYGVEPCFALRKIPRMEGVKGRKLWYGLLTALWAKSEGADLVYGREFYGCFWGGMLGVPTVCETHGPFYEKGKGTRKLFWIARKLALFRYVVTNTEALKKDLQERYSLAETHVIAAQNGVDVDATATASIERKTLGKEERLQVGYIGHLYPGKGMGVIASLAPACPWADFHVVGGTNSDLTYWRDKLAGTENVTLHGFVPNGETPAYRDVFDVCLAPYQKEVRAARGNVAKVTSPLKVFEYMAAGKPIVCSDLPDYRAVLAHEKTALLCDPESIEAWRNALERLRDDDALRERLGTAARAKAEAEYAWTERARYVIDRLLF